MSQQKNIFITTFPFQLKATSYLCGENDILENGRNHKVKAVSQTMWNSADRLTQTSVANIHPHSLQTDIQLISSRLIISPLMLS